MSLRDFVKGIEDFDALGPTDKIRLFSWYLQARGGMERLMVANLSECFDDLDRHKPPNLSQLVTQLVGRDLLRDAKGLRLVAPVRQALDERFGDRVETVMVDRLLAALPASLSDVAQRDYLDEALVCFQSKAFRAAIVMTWNVTYDHLITVVVKKHMPAFNSQIAKMYGGKKGPIATKDDFQDLKESETIEVCRAANIVSREVGKVLRDKLDRRNSAAHPSGSKVDKLQAEEYISNLVQNAMLKIV